MTMFDALLDNATGVCAPDAHDFELGRPPKHFVTSRSIDGEVLSRYGDMSWNWSPYSSGAETINLHFSLWGDVYLTPRRLVLIEDVKWIMFLLIWRHPQRRSLAATTLESTLNVLRIFTRNIDECGMTFKQALANPTFLRSCAPHRSAIVSKVLGLIQFLGEEVTGYSTDTESLLVLKRMAQEWQDSIKQTSPIPTRIYSIILSKLDLEVGRYEAAIDGIISVFREIKENRCTDRPAIDVLIHRYGLGDLMADKNVPHTAQGFSPVLREMQTLLSLQIQAYTGMRANEVRYLPYDCLEEAHTEGDSRLHYVVNGTVTKLSAGRQKITRWVTIDAAARAIRIAKKLALAAYSAKGVAPSKIIDRKSGSLLFPNTDIGGRVAAIWSNDALPATLLMTPRLRTLLGPVIEGADQRELYAIDPHRNWAGEEDFAVGSRWSLRTHQLRRSLALYAQSSGLVSLPSLKRQLNHITSEMTLYYGKGSAFATDFAGSGEATTRKHFSKEWQAAQPISQYLAYAATILLSDADDMFGGHGQWLNVQRRAECGSVLLDRDATIKAIKRGEMAFKTTPLGGCVSISPCERTPINVLSIECISSNCKNLMGSVAKVERIVMAKSSKIRRLKQADVVAAEVRIEEAELEVLKAALGRVRSGRSVT